MLIDYGLRPDTERERARKRIRLAFVVDRLHFTCKFWHSSECESLSLDVVDADSSADGTYRASVKSPVFMIMLLLM